MSKEVDSPNEHQLPFELVKNEDEGFLPSWSVKPKQKQGNSSPADRFVFPSEYQLTFEGLSARDSNETIKSHIRANIIDVINTIRDPWLYVTNLQLAFFSSDELVLVRELGNQSASNASIRNGHQSGLHTFTELDFRRGAALLGQVMQEFGYTGELTGRERVAPEVGASAENLRYGSRYEKLVFECHNELDSNGNILMSGWRAVNTERESSLFFLRRLKSFRQTPIPS